MLQEWEIWHTYSTYCAEPIVDLASAAACLVQSGLAVCAVQSDGTTHWMHDGHYVQASSTIEMSDAGRKAGLRLECPEEANPTGLACEAWYQANYFRWGEMRVFGQCGPLPPPHVQAMIGPCDLHRKDTPSLARCYVGVKLYSPGVLLLEFRVLSPPDDVPLDRFIDSYLKMHEEEFDEIFVPPSVIKLLGRALVLADEPRVTASDLRDPRGFEEFDTEVDRTTERVNGGDFEYSLAPIVMPEEVPFRKTLPELAEMLFAATAASLAHVRGGRGLVRPEKRPLRVPSFGARWEGRTHVHLIRFHDQKKTARENVAAHARALGSIAIGVNCGPDDHPEEMLPACMRPFSDYSVHIRAGNTLWVWSESGREHLREWKDPNHGECVYEHQAIAQLAEYGYTLHRRLLDALSDMGSPDLVLGARRDLVGLRLAMREAGTYGELRDLLETYWVSMRLPEVRDDIDAGLQIELARTQLNERRMVERVGRALTMAIAILAAPTLAKELVVPFWFFLGLPTPSSRVAFQLLSILVSVFVVAALVLGVSGAAQRWWRRRRRAAT